MINKTILGLALAALFVTGSAAAKPGIPKPTAATEISVAGSGLSAAGSFTQSFDLLAESGVLGMHSITVGSLASPFSNLSFTFEGVSTTTTTSGANLAATATLSGLISGQHYTLLVSGVTTAPSAAYTVRGVGFTSITPTAPVPEPTSYAMLLAGLGLMATIARRRRGA